MSRRSFVLGNAALMPWLRAYAAPRSSVAVAVTAGPSHHFCGSSCASPWSADGRFLLVHEVSFAGRRPAAGEEARVGLVDLAAGGVFRPLGPTAAWCWKLGAVPGWLPCAPEREVIYSVREADRWGALRVDVLTGRRRPLPFPIHGFDPDGRRALALNPSRLAWTQPGHGFEGILDRGRHVAAPEDDGVFAVDLERGQARPIVTLARLALFKPLPEFAESYHWAHHPQFNRDGSRCAFAHRWCRPGQPWRTRLYTADPDGGNLRLLLQHGLVSHFTWRDAHTLLAWTDVPSTGRGFYLVDERSGAPAAFAGGVLTQDGHACFSPDGNWVVTDTYPDQRGMRLVQLVRVRDGLKTELCRFASAAGCPEDAACDLNPRWSCDGTRICLDSAHEKTRQVYVIDVARYVKEA